MSTTFDYARSRSTAERLIARFGQPGAIRRASSTCGAYEPDVSTTTFTDYPCKLVVTDYSLREREGSLIEANDRKVLVAAQSLSVEPQEEDVLVIGTDQFAIVNVKAVSPGGVVILYEVQARS